MNEQMPPAVTGPVEPTVMQHTPGPWKASVSNSERYSYTVDAAGPWPYNHVALIPEMYGPHCLTPGAHAANVRLIEAAPDLLAACLALKVAGPLGQREWNAAADMMDAAIAKAVAGAA